MPDLNITPSGDSQAFFSEQIADGPFASPSDYIDNLVEEAKLRAGRERLDALLLEGLDSGPAIEVTPEYWQRTKAKLARKFSAD